MRSSVSKTNPECPAISEVADAIERCFPGITPLTTNDLKPGTRHTAGVAIDIMLNSTNAAQRSRAEGMIAAFIKLHQKMLWSDIIFTDYHVPAGRAGYGGTPFTPNPYTADRRHFDHIHMDWVDFSLKNTGAEYNRIPYKWSTAANTTGFGGALYTELSTLSGGTTPAPPSASVSWIDGWWEVVQEGTTYFYRLTTADGSAAWTYVRPASPTAPKPANPENRGTFAAAADSFTITWDRWATIATVEKFQRTSPGSNSLTGTSNRAGPLTATKIV